MLGVRAHVRRAAVDDRIRAFRVDHDELVVHHDGRIRRRRLARKEPQLRLEAVGHRRGREVRGVDHVAIRSAAVIQLEVRETRGVERLAVAPVRIRLLRAARADRVDEPEHHEPALARREACIAQRGVGRHEQAERDRMLRAANRFDDRVDLRAHAARLG
ncbi:hypothetical protein X941_5766 [Burkholderia pseudomallei MSHR5569]|nr:hypothetical protein X941_5766 [Burkholderia pseudomallei MSHR5569]